MNEACLQWCGTGRCSVTGIQNCSHYVKTSKQTTLRTDAQISSQPVSSIELGGNYVQVVNADFARQLERELQALAGTHAASSEEKP